MTASVGELLECSMLVQLDLIFFSRSSRPCSHLVAVFMLLLDFNDQDAATMLVR